MTRPLQPWPASEARRPLSHAYYSSFRSPPSFEPKSRPRGDRSTFLAFPRSPRLDHPHSLTPHSTSLTRGYLCLQSCPLGTMARWNPPLFLSSLQRRRFKCRGKTQVFLHHRRFRLVPPGLLTARGFICMDIWFGRWSCRPPHSPWYYSLIWMAWPAAHAPPPAVTDFL